jgi:hypothetical protein
MPCRYCLAIERQARGRIVRPLTFYINRAGKNLPASRRRTLEGAKTELRRQFGRE